MIETLTEEEREELMAADGRCSAETSDKALRIIDALTARVAELETQNEKLYRGAVEALKERNTANARAEAAERDLQTARADWRKANSAYSEKWSECESLSLANKVLLEERDGLRKTVTIINSSMKAAESEAASLRVEVERLRTRAEGQNAAVDHAHAVRCKSLRDLATATELLRDVSWKSIPEPYWVERRDDFLANAPAAPTRTERHDPCYDEDARAMAEATEALDRATRPCTDHERALLDAMSRVHSAQLADEKGSLREPCEAELARREAEEYPNGPRTLMLRRTTEPGK